MPRRRAAWRNNRSARFNLPLLHRKTDLQKSRCMQGPWPPGRLFARKAHGWRLKVLIVRLRPRSSAACKTQLLDKRSL
jgi:hypothetical protein